MRLGNPMESVILNEHAFFVRAGHVVNTCWTGVVDLVEMAAYFIVSIWISKTCSQVLFYRM